VELRILVKEKWRKKDSMLSDLGYR
jgi:GTPase Era involved in 16S rRNA processing